MLAQHANTLCDVVVRCLHTPRSATVPGELPPDAGRRTWSLDRRKQLAFQMLFSPYSDFSNSDFVGFRPSKIHMALSLKTRKFYFGDPTTPRTPRSAWKKTARARKISYLQSVLSPFLLARN